MRPVLQDLLDETATLEPRGRWTTSVVYWQDDTMQIVTQHGVVGAKPHTMLRVITTGPIADETIRTQFKKVRERRFELVRGSMFRVVLVGWLQRIQAWGIKLSLLSDEETDIVAAIDRLARREDP